MLPIDFTERMEKMLGEEYPAFLQSYERDKYQALRINPLKWNKVKEADGLDVLEHELAITHSLLEEAGFHLKQIPWEKTGFYYDNTDQPGRHPYHEAGVYYIQEPSAMVPVGYLDVHPGMRVLDLCAAPGGKTTQIAGQMQGRGILVCNEIHPLRAKILSENIERLGVRNALVVNETPQTLLEHFPCFFDRILVDAPCSGEGMFRKNEAACEEWSLENVQICADRQDDILKCAAKMLRPGGKLVYSTCTFAPDEDEGSMARFLKEFHDFELKEMSLLEGMERGNAEFLQHCQVPVEITDEIRQQLERTIRLWPHHICGEGHYAALLQKAGEDGNREAVITKTQKNSCKIKEIPGLQEFLQENICEKTGEELIKRLLRFGEQIYLVPEETPDLKGMKVLRPGLHLGTCKKNRFEPSHSLALTLHQKDVCHTKEMSLEQTLSYLNGQTFAAEGEKGWYLLTICGYGIGWGKLAGGIMKNHYPKGLRK